MSYRIEYDPKKNKKYPAVKRGRPKFLIVAIAIMTILFAFQRLSTNNTIRKWFLPGDPDITDAALSAMVAEIRGGTPVKDAVTAFCLEIIEHGQDE